MRVEDGGERDTDLLMLLDGLLCSPIPFLQNLFLTNIAVNSIIGKRFLGAKEDIMMPSFLSLAFLHFKV